MPYGTPPRRLERGRSNRFLATLPPHDFALLAPHLRTVTLERGAMLHDAAEEIERVYFPHNGMVSLVVVMQSGATIETATIGRAGVIGASTGLGEKHSVGRVVVIFPVARQRNVKFVIGTALNAGFISGSPRYNYGKTSWNIPHQYIEKRERLRAVAAQFGADLRTAALQFSAAPDVAAALIVGAHTEAQVLANVSSMQATMPPEFWAELKRQNFIEQNAPTPTAA